MIRAIVLGLALIATVSVHAVYEFVPPAPNDQSFVFLVVRGEMWRDGCVPWNPFVTRTGRTIEVMWSTPGGDAACPLIVSEWSSEVPLGVLEAGVYTVRMRVNDGMLGEITSLGTKTLIVDEASPSFLVTPRVVRAGTPGVARIFLCTTSSSEPLVVTVGGIVAEAQANNCTIDVTLPLLPPGAVDVHVRAGDRELEVVNALRYIDPEAAPDPALFERVLVPILFHGPGAYGSLWETQVEMINASKFDSVEFLHEPNRPLTSLAPGAATSLSAFGNRPSGLVLFIPRGADLRFGSIVRDISRDADDLGTEVRVAREAETRPELILPNVPFDPRYRVQLRIYDIEGVTAAVNVFARGEGVPQMMTQALVTGPCEDVPCNSNQPAYAFVDLTDAFPSLEGRRHVTIASVLEARRLWAVLTVTNNVTQRVTVITPQ